MEGLGGEATDPIVGEIPRGTGTNTTASDTPGTWTCRHEGSGDAGPTGEGWGLCEGEEPKGDGFQKCLLIPPREGNREAGLERDGWGAGAWPGTATHRRRSSPRPRKAPGCTVLMMLFLRSLRETMHRSGTTQTPSLCCPWQGGSHCLPARQHRIHGKSLLSSTLAREGCVKDAPRHSSQPPRFPLQKGRGKVVRNT